MNILVWIVIGFIAGAIAKSLMPGSRNEPSGLLGTILLGIVGSVIGGWLSSMFLNGNSVRGLDLMSVVVAVAGSCVFIGLLRLIRG